MLLLWTTIIALVASCNHFMQLANGLKVSVSIPKLVKLNDAFWLNCTHKQEYQPQATDPNNNLVGARQGKEESDDIYAIKWYKNDEEFYRYLPNAQPKVSIYETNGIQLDVSIRLFD